MSWRASAWAKELRLGSPHGKAIVLCLADYADAETAECWPSQERLAADAEVSLRNVRDWLSRLEAWGLIERIRRNRATGARDTDCIRLNLAVSVTDGGERLRENNGEAPPAEVSDESLPATVAGRSLPATGDKPTGNGCRAYKEEPPNRTSQERERCAGAREDAGDATENATQTHASGLPLKGGEETTLSPDQRKRLFETFWRDWPSAVADSRPAAERAWSDLTDDERRAAVADAGRYREAVAKAGRKHVCSAGRYLAEKRWAELPPAPAVAARPATDDGRAPPFGPVWGAALADAWLAGPAGEPPQGGVWLRADLVRCWPKLAQLADLASMRRGFEAGPRLQRLAALCEPVPVASDRMAAWRAELAARGWPDLPPTGEQQVIYLPKGDTPAAALAAFEVERRS